MRERKRDWPVIVYKFWARPLGDIPQELWNIAHEMNNVWNSLVQLRTVAADQSMTVKEKEQKKAVWNSFWLQARDCTKASQLNWDIKGDLFDRFASASRRATKEQLPMMPHYGLRRIMIPQRFTGGGIPAAKIFKMDATARRLKIEPIPPEAYRDNRRASKRKRLSRGTFRLTKSINLEFEIIFHRALPTEAMLKKAMWVGEFIRSLPPSRRWSWSLHLVCEIPPEVYCRKPTKPGRPVCAIDLGWRVMLGGEYLRIGMVVDSLGRAVELRLPLHMRRKRDENKEGWIASLHELIAFDSKIDLELEDAKAKVAGLLLEKPAGFEKMRQNGLRKLLRETTDQSVISVLKDWEERNQKLSSIRATVRQRIKRRKSWLYKNVAVWLTTTYGRVVLEGNFPLKFMSRRSDNPVFRSAARYREWAGVGELRRSIVYAARRYGSEIVEAETFGTTRQCFFCSADHEGEKLELYLECPNGHRWDQDINAAQNILASLFKNDHQQHSSSEMEKGTDCSLEIPTQLREAVVPCSIE